MKKTIHIVPHSHWDREWYMPFESHRMRLVELIDNIIELMESDSQYCRYHLDGQTIAIEDYLEIRPQNRERLMKLIRDDKIQVGPWYVLQDEFLTDGESNIRNLMTGIKYCKDNGIKPILCGYLPDAFGNISQMPQILRGFGIDNAVFGRGVGRILFNNNPDPNGAGEKTEFLWSSPDGSKVMGIKFLGWYNNGAELPQDPDSIKNRLESLAKNADKAGCTPFILLMNGSDHQPLQKNLTNVIKNARAMLPGINIIQSGIKEYLEAIRQYSDSFTPLSGEMCSQNTVGFHNLINTASTHIPLKQKNHTVQNLLLAQSEPVNVMSHLFGDELRKDQLDYAWKTLMQNHPHDSICCCSCDEVTNEMSVRFDKAEQVAKYITSESEDYITDRIASPFEKNICVFHGVPYNGPVTVTAELRYSEEMDISALALFDFDGNRIPAEFTALGKQFRYTLPKDSFRKVTHPYVYKVRFPYEFKGIGYTSFYIGEDVKPTDHLVSLTPNGAENEFVSVKINTDGTIDVTDKKSGRVFSGLNRYENLGDRGTSYDFEQVVDERAIYPTDNSVIELYSENCFEVTYKITSHLNIPSGLDGDTRAKDTIGHEIFTFVTVSAHSSVVNIHAEFENRAENHRLRALFPCQIQSDTDIADGQLDVLNRPIIPFSGWQNPENPQRCRAFFGIKDAKAGALVATKGLHEYEVMRYSDNTLALTLMRAVGEVGDWGDFPAPNMQLKQKLVFDYAFIPFSAEELSGAYSGAYSFYYGAPSAVQFDGHGGELPTEKTLVAVNGNHIAFSCFKTSEDGLGTVLRLYNTSDTKQTWKINTCDNFSNIELVEMCEDTIICETNGSITAEPKKVYTFKLT